MKESKPVKTPLEMHMAHFYKNSLTEKYKRELLVFWRSHYGDKIVDKVIELANKR